MRCKRLLRLCALFLILGFSFSSIQAQQKTTTPLQTEVQTYPGFLPSIYIGARGGYLLKDNQLSKDPAFYLNSGYFGEINAGWRSKNNWFGWNLSVGHLNLERIVPSISTDSFSVNSYNFLKSSDPNWMWDSIKQDGRTYDFDSLNLTKQDKKDMSSWYVMTGPEFWFGKKKLQGFVSLNAGVGFTNFGYYYVEGNYNESNPQMYSYYSKDNEKVTGMVSTQVVNNTFSQYGMSEKSFEDYTKGDKIDESEINFMARASVGIEYFISPKFSIDASASYWYIMTPDWAGAKEYKGTLMFRGEWQDPTTKPGPDDFTPPTGGFAINGEIPYDRVEKFEKKDLGLISANIGIKFWLGREATPQEPQKIEPTPEPKQVEEKPEVHAKKLLVTVKDKPTGFALSGVKVTVTKDGNTFYSGMTDANGALPDITDLKAGNYKIQGTLNGIETTIATLTPSDFEGESRVISRELQHNDLRFTLIGHTIDANTEGNLPHIKTSLTQEGGGENSVKVSDDDGEFRFQLQPKSDFTVFAEQKGYFSNREKVTTKGLDRSKTLYVDLRLKVNELKEGATFELENIYYDFDKSNIRPDAAKVLDDLYETLKQNPTMVIELSSHTDSRGSDAYNLKLSQERASSAVAYLVKKGIDPSRLKAKGYGETKPVNGCVNGVPCTEEEHQANRRTEIKVLKE